MLDCVEVSVGVPDRDGVMVDVTLALVVTLAVTLALRGVDVRDKDREAVYVTGVPEGEGVVKGRVTGTVMTSSPGRISLHTVELEEESRSSVAPAIRVSRLCRFQMTTLVMLKLPPRSTCHQTSP